ncbi:hypothetical protein GMDG_01155 [Pseudogymnoascus destructans 20631-21]|uniref:Uncharacterized protein n=1 Tax=Pseudogymnoascus destructans (strain ATCC MYA-4855 / 20631-21) TaxID=658429 RepID=L8FQW3_PSED2|nr:hypothetical protein GMDG_01155 [Pseudogymnoascus destructans 20631-21]
MGGRYMSRTFKVSIMQCRWFIVLMLGTEVKTVVQSKDKGKEAKRPKHPKVIGTSIIRLPKFTKGLGRVVQPVKPSAETKGKGKVVESSEPSDAKGKGKAVEPPEPPDAKGKGKAVEPSEPLDAKVKDKAVQTTVLPDDKRKSKVVEPSEPPDAKGKGKPVEPSEPLVAKGKGKPHEPSKPPDDKGKEKADELPEPPDAKSKGKADELSEPADAKGEDKAVQMTELPHRKYIDKAVQTLDTKTKAVQTTALPDIEYKDKAVQTPDNISEDRSAEPPGLPVNKDKGKAVESLGPSDEKGEGKSAEPLGPPDDKGEGKAVESLGSPDEKGEGKAVEPLGSPDDKGESKAAEPLGPPDDQGKGTAAEPPELLDDKGKGKAVEQPEPLDGKSKDEAVEQPELPDRKGKGKANEGHASASDEIRQAIKLLTDEHKATVSALRFSYQEALDKGITDASTSHWEELKALAYKYDEARGNMQKALDAAGKQPQSPDANGKGKAVEGQKSQQDALAPGNQTPRQKSKTAPHRGIGKRTRQEEEAFPRIFPRSRPHNFTGTWREDLSHPGWGPIECENFKVIFTASAYMTPFWVLTVPTACEPLERYRCLWNAGIRLYTKFFETIFKEEKTLQVGMPGMLHFIGLFEGFAKTGILQRMIHASMSIMTQLMDPKQKSKFPIKNLWDVGNRVEENINHWFNINVIFHTRMVWYKRFFGLLSVHGDALPIPLSMIAPSRALPN